MTETEGVIKYQLHHKFSKLPNAINCAEINKFRSLIYDLGLIGQNPDRYLGYGYGNISQRHENNKFIISGTQTGGKQSLLRNAYCLVTQVSLAENNLYSMGECKPSSEALSHASVYQKNSAIQCVIHAHNPEIWHATQRLNLPHTTKDIAYGTPAMANAIALLINQPSSGIFTMLGHEDGVIAYGKDFSTAFNLLIKALSDAKQI